jgi:60Kd inner membrane protein
MWNSCSMRIASVRERLLAALVDAAVVILAMAVVVGLGVRAAVACARIRSEDDEDEADEDEHEDEEDESPFRSRRDGDLDDLDDRSRRIQQRTREFLQSPLVHAPLQGAGAGLAIANRNWRSPGFRVVGLRRVDAHRRAHQRPQRFDRIAARPGTASNHTPVFRSRAHHERDRLRELAPKLKAIQHRYEGDQQAQQRATMEFYKANQINPLAGCGRLAAGPILSQLVLASAIRNGRTAYDRLTGTLVVSDR